MAMRIVACSRSRIFPKTSQIAGLLVQAGSNTAQRTQLSLAPDERQRVVLNIPATAPMLTAELTPDALAEDNRVQLLPPIRHRVRVQVALTNSALTELIDRTLAATGLRASISENPELIIHHSDTSPNNTAWSLNWTIPEKTTAYTGPFIVDDSHPLAQGIGLGGRGLGGGAMTNSKTDVPIILAGKCAVGVDARRHHGPAIPHDEPGPGTFHGHENSRLADSFLEHPAMARAGNSRADGQQRAARHRSDC